MKNRFSRSSAWAASARPWPDARRTGPGRHRHRRQRGQRPDASPTFSSPSSQLDATDERALRAAGIQDVDVAVISIGENIEASLLVGDAREGTGRAADHRQGRDAAARPDPREDRRGARDLPRARDGHARRPQPGRAQRHRLHRTVARLQHHRHARAGSSSSGKSLKRPPAAQPVRPHAHRDQAQDGQPATARSPTSRRPPTT